MSRTLSAHQLVRAKSAAAKAVQIVKLTAYSDFDARTVSSTFYWATSAIRYDYGNTGTTQHIPAFLVGISPLIASMPHLPNPSGLDYRTLTLTISNEDYLQGFSLISGTGTVQGETNWLGASVELAELLIDDFGAPFTDLSALVGDEHTVLFRGEVQRLGPLEDLTWQLQCRTVLPRVEWARSRDALSDPKDLGVRLPIVYGRAKKVACVNTRVGSVSTLSASCTAAQTLFDVTDTSRFGTTGNAVIGTEEVTWTGKSASQLTGVTRGANATFAAAHNAGDALVESLDQITVALAQHPIVALDALYVRNPMNGLLTLVPPIYALFQPDSFIVASKGFPCAICHFEKGSIRALAQHLFASATVTQQPNFVASTVPTNVNDEIATAQSQWFTSLVRDGNTATGNTLSFLTTFNNPASGSVYWNAPSGPITALTIEVYVGSITAEAGVRIEAGGQSFAFSSTVGAFQSFTFTAQSAFDANSARISCAFGSSINVREVRRDYTYSAPPVVSLPTVPTAIEAAAAGYGLEFYADLRGYPVPRVWQEAYDLDASAGWNSSPACLYVNDIAVKREGTASAKVRMTELDTTMVRNCDATTGWTGTNCTPTVDTATKTEGSGSVKGIAATAAATDLQNIFAAALNMSSPKRYLALDVVSSYTTMNGNVRITIGSSGTDFEFWDFDALANFVPGTFNTILLHPDATPTGTGGAINKAAIDRIKIQWNIGSTLESGATFFIDNIRHLNQDWNVQKNDLGALDFNAVDAAYRFWARGSQLDTVPRDVVIYFADAPGSGSTIPADRWDLDFDNLDQVANDLEWMRIEFAVLEVNGTPGSAASIDTLGIFVSLGLLAHGVHRVLSIDFSVWVDLIDRRAADGGSEYEAAVGALLEHPADVLRHWVEEIGGATFDDTEAATAFTNLGAAAKLACDMRALSAGSWEEGAARLGFESRANLVPDERAAGTVWRMLTAEADFGFTAAVQGTLSAYEGRAFMFKGLDQLWTRFQFFFAIDPSLGEGEEAFTKVVRIGPGTTLAAPSSASILTAEKLRGVRFAEPMFFLAIQDQAFAEQVAAYYAFELLRADSIASTISVRQVPWYTGDLGAIAYLLELGDLRGIALLGTSLIGGASRWNAASPTYRLIEVVRSFGSQDLQYDLTGVGIT